MKIKFSPAVQKARDDYFAARKILKSFKFEEVAYAEWIGKRNGLKKQVMVARKKWNDLSVEQINRVITKEEAAEAFRAAPWGSAAKLLALERWAELCVTIEDLRAAYEVSQIRFGRKENPVYLKWETTACLEICLVNTMKEAEEVFWDAPPNAYHIGSVGLRAFEKWLSFCATTEMLEILGRRMEGRIHGRLRRAYIERLEEITGHKHIPNMY